MTHEIYKQEQRRYRALTTLTDVSLALLVTVAGVTCLAVLLGQEFPAHKIQEMIRVVFGAMVAVLGLDHLKDRSLQRIVKLRQSMLVASRS